MNWGARFEEALASWSVALGSVVFAGLVWVLRNILTNQKRLDLLEVHLENQSKVLARALDARDNLRAEDKRAVEDMKAEVSDLRKSFYALFSSRLP